MLPPVWAGTAASRAAASSSGRSRLRACAWPMASEGIDVSYRVTSKWLDPSVRAEFVATDTSDGVALHGAYYVSEATKPHDLALLAYHGSGGNFYAGPCGFLAPGVASRGYV